MLKPAKPEDQWESLCKSDLNYYFSDVQVRGAYSRKALKFLEKNNVHLAQEREDNDILKKGTVDFIWFQLLPQLCC